MCNCGQNVKKWNLGVVFVPSFSLKDNVASGNIVKKIKRNRFEIKKKMK
jgi:hypothetical protein